MSPFVYMIMPNSVLSTFRESNVEALTQNQNMPVTPLNIYHTLRDLIDGQVSSPSNEARTSLFSPIRPDIECETMVVPEKYCRRTVLHNNPPKLGKCRIAKHYPNYKTFTMDQNEPFHSIKEACIVPFGGVSVTWEQNEIKMNCSKLETGLFWTRPNDASVKNFLKQDDEGQVTVPKNTEILYSVCNNKFFPEQTRASVKLRNVKQQKTISRSTTLVEKISQEALTSVQLPDIYMINVDSASRPESLRGLKYTLSKLKQLSGTRYSYYDFSIYNTVGFNTIPNQVAALSGCVARDLQGNSLYINSDVSPSLVYEIPTPVSNVYQFLCSKNQLEIPTSDAQEDIWLFDYLKNRGYISLWAQDTCPKEEFNLHNFFKKKTQLTDHSSGDFNCEKTNENFHKNSFCVAGKYAHSYTLDYLEQFTQNYKDNPKFGLIDLMAAQQCITSLEFFFPPFIQLSEIQISHF